MQQSRLRLEHYNLMHLHIEPVIDAESPELGSYADFAKAAFSSNIQFNPVELPNGESRYTVDLTLVAGPQEGQSNFPYRLKIQLLGIFDGRELPAEKRESLVAANGASMLYGIAREMLLGLTFRSVGGPVMLPTVEFSQFGDTIQRKHHGDNSLPEAKPAAELTAPRRKKPTKSE
jgi:preprotein translocase subunit SecB